MFSYQLTQTLLELCLSAFRFTQQHQSLAPAGYVKPSGHHGSPDQGQLTGMEVFSAWGIQAICVTPVQADKETTSYDLSWVVFLCLNKRGYAASVQTADPHSSAYLP